MKPRKLISINEYLMTSEVFRSSPRCPVANSGKIDIDLNFHIANNTWHIMMDFMGTSGWGIRFYENALDSEIERKYKELPR